MEARLALVELFKWISAFDVTLPASSASTPPMPAGSQGSPRRCAPLVSDSRVSKARVMTVDTAEPAYASYNVHGSGDRFVYELHKLAKRAAFDAAMPRAELSG
jgi:hypothetical protein